MPQDLAQPYTSDPASYGLISAPFSESTDTVLITNPTTDKVIRVYALSFSCFAENSIIFEEQGSATAVAGPFHTGGTKSVELPFAACGWFEVPGAGLNLHINVSAANICSGVITYAFVDRTKGEQQDRFQPICGNPHGYDISYAAIGQVIGTGAGGAAFAPALPGFKQRLLGCVFDDDGSGTTLVIENVTSGDVGGADLTGEFHGAHTANVSMPFCPVGWGESASGLGLRFANTGGANAASVGGIVIYATIPA